MSRPLQADQREHGGHRQPGGPVGLDWASGGTSSRSLSAPATSNGPVAIGAKAKATAQGVDVEAALRMLEQVRQSAADASQSERVELLDAVAELRTAVEQDAPQTGDGVKKVGKLRAIGDKIGVASISAATGGAAQARPNWP